MLVKIQSTDGGWRLIDNAKEIEYSSHTRKIHKQDEIEQLADHAACDEEIFVLTEKFPLEVRTLTFRRDQLRYFVIFSTVTFICDDTGRTLEALRIYRKDDNKNG